MSEQPPPETENHPDLTSELRDLGQNIVRTLKAAWESPDRKRLQSELEDGLNEIAETINSEVQTFSESPSGQRLKSDVEDIREKIRTGEAEAQVRQELLNALRTANQELQRVAQSFRERSTEKEEPTQE